MDENFCALIIAIVKNCTQEQSFEMFNTGRIHKNFNISDAEVEEMGEFKSQGLSYTEIGEMFGISRDTVYRKLRKAAVKVQ